MESMRVPLTQGKWTTVDVADYDRVVGWTWCAQRIRGCWYATRQVADAAAPQRRRTIYMHRFIVAAPDGLEVDHRDGDGLNNRRSNLRIATRGQNAANQRRNRRNTSGLIGVSWDTNRGKWEAYVKANGKRRHVGRFDSLEAAGRARDTAARALHGPFARLNFPD